MVSSSNTGTRLLRDKGGRRDMEGTSSVVSALAKEEDCSSSEGTVVRSGGAGGDNVGCTGAEGAAGSTSKGPSSLSW